MHLLRVVAASAFLVDVLLMGTLTFIRYYRLLYMYIGQRCNCARIPAAAEGREECSLIHSITMCSPYGTHDTDFGHRAMKHGDVGGIPYP